MEMFNIKCRNLPFLLTAAAQQLLWRFLCLELKLQWKLLQNDCFFTGVESADGLHLLLAAAVETHRDVKNLHVYRLLII